MHPQKTFPGELALLAGLLLNALAVTLFIRADFGITVVSGVPYVLSLAFPTLSMGAWNTLAQCAWLLVVMAALRSFRPGYVLSFGLAIVFGALLDFWAWAVTPLPQTLVFRCLCFACGYVSMSFGIAFFMRCGLPVLPFDTVPRAFVLAKGWSVRTARTGFDLINLALMLSVGLIFLGRPAGIGPATILNALLMGVGSGYATSWLDKKLDIRPRLVWLARLS